MPEQSAEVTRLLRELSRDNPQAANALVPLIYGELRRLARSYMRRERSGHTLQPTALVSEVFLRLAGADPIDWQSRAHFFGVAARLMREVLVDYARKRGSAKRAGGWTNADWDFTISSERLDDVLGVHEVLERLEAFDARQARIVELRFFAGMNIAEIAEVIGVSTPTVKREWASAKAWLHREITGGAHGPGEMATG